MRVAEGGETEVDHSNYYSSYKKKYLLDNVQNFFFHHYFHIFERDGKTHPVQKVDFFPPLDLCSKISHSTATYVKAEKHGFNNAWPHRQHVHRVKQSGSDRSSLRQKHKSFTFSLFERIHWSKFPYCKQEEWRGCERYLVFKQWFQSLHATTL